MTTQPDDEAWNSLMRGRVPDAPKEGTVRVRIPVRVHSDGCVDIDFLQRPDGSVPARACTPTCYITADLPLPKPVEVVGRVEP